ncbi:hypothetical protein D3C87_2132190 [compost metagenome]
MGAVVLECPVQLEGVKELHTLVVQVELIRLINVRVVDALLLEGTLAGQFIVYRAQAFKHAVEFCIGERHLDGSGDV